MNKDQLLTRLDAWEKEGKQLRSLLKKTDGPVTDRIKTFADVCEELGLDANKVLPHPDPQSEDEIATNAFVKVSLIAKALNEGWKPNWDDSSEYKYYPWFDMRGSAAGSGFSYSLYGGSYTAAGVGSRLCFKSAALAMYAGTQFEEEYKQLFILK